MTTEPLHQTMPLSMSTCGARLRIACVRAGQGSIRKVIDMGLISGTEIEVLQQQRGSVVISAGNTRYALGAAMARQILVWPV